MRSLLALLLSLTLLTACKKEEVLTSGEKVAQDIQARVGSSTRVQVIAHTSSGTETDSSLQINGQFIRVGNSNYNLSQLISYRYDGQNLILNLQTTGQNGIDAVLPT